MNHQPLKQLLIVLGVLAFAAALFVLFAPKFGRSESLAQAPKLQPPQNPTEDAPASPFLPTQFSSEHHITATPKTSSIAPSPPSEPLSFATPVSAKNFIANTCLFAVLNYDGSHELGIKSFHFSPAASTITPRRLPIPGPGDAVYYEVRDHSGNFQNRGFVTVIPHTDSTSAVSPQTIFQHTPPDDGFSLILSVPISTDSSTINLYRATAYYGTSSAMPADFHASIGDFLSTIDLNPLGH